MRPRLAVCVYLVLVRADCCCAASHPLSAPRPRVQMPAAVLVPLAVLVQTVAAWPGQSAHPSCGHASPDKDGNYPSFPGCLRKPPMVTNQLAFLLHPALAGVWIPTATILTRGRLLTACLPDGLAARPTVCVGLDELGDFSLRR